MDQSLYSEANSRSANQDNDQFLWNSNAHYRVHNSPRLNPILSQMHLATPSLSTYEGSISVLSSHVHLGHFSFPLKILYGEHFLSLKFSLYALPISQSFNHHPTNICCSTDYEVPHYTMLSTIFLLSPSLLRHNQSERPSFTHTKRHVQL
jgi:hypothetical protein